MLKPCEKNLETEPGSTLTWTIMEDIKSSRTRWQELLKRALPVKERAIARARSPM